MHNWSEKRRTRQCSASTTSDIRCKVLIGRGRVRISEQCVFNTNTNTKTQLQTKIQIHKTVIILHYSLKIALAKQMHKKLDLLCCLKKHNEGTN